MELVNHVITDFIPSVQWTTFSPTLHCISREKALKPSKTSWCWGCAPSPHKHHKLQFYLNYTSHFQNNYGNLSTALSVVRHAMYISNTWWHTKNGGHTCLIHNFNWLNVRVITTASATWHIHVVRHAPTITNPCLLSAHNIVNHTNNV